MRTRKICLSGQQRMAHDRKMNVDVNPKPMTSVYVSYTTSLWNLDKLYEKSTRGLCDLNAWSGEDYEKSAQDLYEICIKYIDAISWGPYEGYMISCQHPLTMPIVLLKMLWWSSWKASRHPKTYVFTADKWPYRRVSVYSHSRKLIFHYKYM